MTRSVSFSHWQPSGNAAPQPVYGIQPEVLMSSGILRNPNVPEQAYLRAKSLVRQGRYREARSIVFPHIRTAAPDLRPHLAELLAECALHGGGGDWEPLLASALEAQTALDDALGAARVRTRLGAMHLVAGHLRLADQHLRQASHTYRDSHQLGRAAWVECIRTRIRARAGLVIEAQQRIERTLAAVVGREPRVEALARLERGRILGMRDDGNGAARELVLAEHVLGVSGNAAERLQTRIARAEMLLALGADTRAERGLRRLAVEVADLEDVELRAMVAMLLGQSLLDTEPANARRSVLRARHLFESIRAEYFVIWADVLLARIEHRLGLHPGARLDAARAVSFAEWPLLRAELAIAVAEVEGRETPEEARDGLLVSRAFANQHGNASMVRKIDAVLVATKLARDVDGLTPVNARERVPVVQGGSSVTQDTKRTVVDAVAHEAEAAAAAAKRESSKARPAPMAMSSSRSSEARKVKPTLRRPLRASRIGSQVASS